MSAWMMHRNPEVFPDPMKYDPTRWLDPVTFRKLDSNIMTFGGGSRACVGMP
jgi:cytochrome P450